MERDAWHPRKLLGYHPDWKFKDDRHFDKYHALAV
jgi:hypothetical protein